MIYDRVLKSELMNSDRWLDLPSDSHRLAYVCLLPLADDFGNFEAGPRRMWRWLHARTQVKDEGHSIKILSDLMDADLLRPYRVAEVDYWHIARFECDRKYISRKVPASPWDDIDLETRAKHYRQYYASRRADLKRKKAKPDPNLTPIRGRSGVSQGIGVGVGVKKNTCSFATSLDLFWIAYPRKIGKAKALKAYIALKPDDALQKTMLVAIGRQRQSEQWSTLRFIPHPTTWLNERRWEDELEPPIADYLRHGKVI